MRAIILPMLFASFSSAACAQPSVRPQPAAATAPALAERMAPFGWLIGNWRGGGWTLLPDGSRHRFESREIVVAKLSGNAILVEGRHSEPGQPDRVVHDAMAMITWESRANAYRFRSALANGMGGDFKIEPTANGFTWRIDTPGGQIVYTVAHENGVWSERGSRPGPGGTSVDFFEMILRRE